MDQSDDINGSFTFFILHIPNYRTICLYVVDWSTHYLNNNAAHASILIIV